MWLPLTVYGAVPGPPLIAPAELLPSPQSIVAEKSLNRPVVAASWKVAVAPENACSVKAGIAHSDVSGASATLTLNVVEAVRPVVSVAVRVPV